MTGISGTKKGKMKKKKKKKKKRRDAQIKDSLWSHRTEVESAGVLGATFVHHELQIWVRVHGWGEKCVNHEWQSCLQILHY